MPDGYGRNADVSKGGGGIRPAVKVLRDPVHGSLAIPDWCMPLVDAPVLQRLRRIQQLGTAHLVYPGANHRRFEHSLGAQHLGGRIAMRLGLDAGEGNTVRAAALLHDVGHGPFSHAFDELLREEGRRHEDVSVDLVRWGPLADLLRQAGVDPVAVADAIAGRGPLAAVVSGPLDADRMDYLLRDAHYTGVPSSVDADRLIEVMARDAEGIILEESGVVAAEGLLSMRFLMYPAVYLHHTVRASEAMLQAAVRRFVADGNTRLSEIERETDDGLLHRMRQAGGTAAEIVRRLDDRRLHKRAWEADARTVGADAVLRLADDPALRLRLQQEVADAAGVQAHEAILDVPHPPRFRETGIRVQHRTGGARSLAEASRLVAVLQEARLDHWRAWVFAPKPLREKVATAAQRVLGSLA
jgi:hypothetical protein